MFEPGTLGQAGTEHIKAKLIENTNFPRIVDVEKRPHLSETINLIYTKHWKHMKLYL